MKCRAQIHNHPDQCHGEPQAPAGEPKVSAAGRLFRQPSLRNVRAIAGLARRGGRPCLRHRGADLSTCMPRPGRDFDNCRRLSHAASRFGAGRPPDHRALSGVGVDPRVPGTRRPRTHSWRGPALEASSLGPPRHPRPSKPRSSAGGRRRVKSKILCLTTGHLID